ncbi:MAG: putative phosphohydrolase [Chlamydiales bacterium]|jgi:predicted phosphohydrolase
MSVWAIADLHLSFGVPGKKMDVFGPEWASHEENIKNQWEKLISPDDLVIIAGDISWAKHLEEVKVDLAWIDSLPGSKVLLRGNHDYWWTSTKKMQAIMPPSIHFIHNNTFNWGDITIGGSRLWDSDEYSFNDFIEWKEVKGASISERDEDKSTTRKIFERELGRLQLSLKGLNPESKTRIAITHYPPIGADLINSEASAILEEHNIDYCIFGHLHSLKKGLDLFGEKNGIQYVLSSCDYLNFTPIKIID